MFLIHSSVKGHLACLQVLTMTNNAAMNIGEHIPLCYDWASFGIDGSWGRLFPNFLRNSHIDIHVAVPVYAHTSNAEVFPLLHILCNLNFHQCFWSCPFLQVKIESSCCLIWISLMANDVKNFLKCLSVTSDKAVESFLFRPVFHFLMDYTFSLWSISWNS